MKKGFTLIELVTVITILAILTHMAVRQFTNVSAQKLLAVTEKNLSQIQEAVVHSTDSFYADMGRLPRALPQQNNMQRLTLSELWEMPQDVKPFQIRQALRENLAPGTDPTIADPSVYIPCGWRGPYCSAPKTGAPTDGWKNPIQNPDDAGFPRLFDSTTNPVTAFGKISLICHYGCDGQPDGGVAVAREKQDAYFSFEEPARPRRLFIRPSFVDSDGVERTIRGANVSATWYMPADGAITGGVTSAENPAPIIIEDLSGPACFIKVRTDSVTGMLKRVTLRPGDNDFHEKLRIP